MNRVARPITESGGRDPPLLFNASCQLAESGYDVEEEELSPELKEFIDQLIVPLLVELVKNGHLYNAEATRYDGDADGLADAA